MPRINENQIAGLLTYIRNVDPTMAGWVASLVEEVQEKRKTVEIGPAQFYSTDPLYCKWYHCPRCHSSCVAQTFPHCPDCGVKLTWKE